MSVATVTATVTATVVVQQGADTNTEVLLHMNGENNSTTFTDEYGKTWTAAGNAKLSTAQKKFGTASYSGDGTTDYIYTADHADFDQTAGDFTIDFWVRMNVLPPNDTNKYVLVAQSTDISHWFYIEIYNNAGTYVLVFEHANGGQNPSYGTITPSIDVWYHVAAVRYGDDLYLYFNGTRIENITSYDWDSWALNYTGTFRVGASWDEGYSLNGYIDEFRYSSVARYTGASYSVPTEEY